MRRVPKPFSGAVGEDRLTRNHVRLRGPAHSLQSCRSASDTTLPRNRLAMENTSRSMPPTLVPLPGRSISRVLS